VLSFLFFTVFLGNIVTTMMVIPQKLKEKVKLKERFIALDKYFRRQNREGPPGPSGEAQTTEPVPGSALSKDGETRKKEL